MSQVPADSATSPRPCIACGRCLEVCPLLAATGQEEFSPRAKYTLAHRSAPLAGRESQAQRLAALCLGCGRCRQACPQGLCAAELVDQLRADHPGFQEWLWQTWLTKAGRLWPAVAAVARHVPGEVAKRLPLGPALAPLKGLSGPPPDPWLALRPDPAVGQGRAAVLFPGCTAGHVRSSWTRVARGLVAGLGFALGPPPDFVCCGSSLGHAGATAAQARCRRTNLDVWRRAGRPLVVVFCATCRHGLAAYAQADLDWAPGEAAQWRAALTPLDGLLAQTQAKVLPGAPEAVFVHRPCHGDEQRADEAFLTRVLGPRLRGVATDCCGFGGILQLGAPELSRRVATTYWQRLGPPAGSQVLTGCSGCVAQLAATAPEGVTVAHWLDIMVQKG